MHHFCGVCKTREFCLVFARTCFTHHPFRVWACLARVRCTFPTLVGRGYARKLFCARGVDLGHFCGLDFAPFLCVLLSKTTNPAHSPAGRHDGKLLFQVLWSWCPFRVTRPLPSNETCLFVTDRETGKVELERVDSVSYWPWLAGVHLVRLTRPLCNRVVDNITNIITS